MTYAAPFLRLVLSGTLHTVEGFSFGVSLISDGSGVEAPAEVPAGVVTAAQTLMTGAIISGAADLDTIKLNLIGTDGRYAGDNTVMHEFAPPVGGTYTATNAPQVAIAVSLDTAARRGLATRGRFYLPTPVPVVKEDGRIDAASATAFATAATTFLQSVSAALPGWIPGVVSNVGAGAQRPVTNVRVGRVYDTIRSRRTSLPEDYVTGPTIFGGGAGDF